MKGFSIGSGFETKARLAATYAIALLTFAVAACSKPVVNPNLNLERLLPYASKTSHVYFAQTTDGRSIALRRTEPNIIREGLPPLILCHDEGMNSVVWHLGGEKSFTEYFSNLGFDVWAIDFRGHGESTKPEWHNEQQFDWNFDDYVHKDLPAVISFVQGETNSRYVTLVGHGVGAMAIYAYLETENFFDEVANAVLIAPPGFAGDYTPELKELISRTADWDRSSPLSLRYLPDREEDWRLFSELMIHGTPMQRLTIKRLSERAMEVVSPKVIQQMIYWVEANDFLSADLSFSYRNKLSLIKVPLLVIAGSADRFAPTGAVNYGFRVVTSPDKTLQVFGREWGHLDEYSHLGLLLGVNAREEVYPVIFEWIENRTPDFDVWGKF